LQASGASQDVASGNPQAVPAVRKPLSTQVPLAQVSWLMHSPAASPHGAPFEASFARHAPSPSQLSAAVQAFVAALPHAAPADRNPLSRQTPLAQVSW
jgi:hypothetical protein